MARRALNYLSLDCFGTVLSNEGGAIQVDGGGTFITTESVLLNPNRSSCITKADIDEIFKRLLGLKMTIWLPGDPRYVTVDGLCTFVRPAVLLVDATYDQQLV